MPSNRALRSATAVARGGRRRGRRGDNLALAMSEATPTSEPPPGAEELSEAGIPEGGLVADAPAQELLPVSAHRHPRQALRRALQERLGARASPGSSRSSRSSPARLRRGASRSAAAAPAARPPARPDHRLRRSPRARRRTTSSPHTRRAAASLASAARAACRPSLRSFGAATAATPTRSSTGFCRAASRARSPTTRTRRPRRTRTATATRRTTTSPWRSPSFPRPRRSSPSWRSSAASGFRFLDGAEDVFRTRQRVEVESELADKKFEIFTGKNDDMVKARRRSSPPPSSPGSARRPTRASPSS